MKAYRIERDGSVTVHEGRDNFWMDGDTVFTATSTTRFPKHALYYDDESLSDPAEIRATVAGVSAPLPAWFVGTDGHLDCDPHITPDELAATIVIPGRAPGSTLAESRPKPAPSLDGGRAYWPTESFVAGCNPKTVAAIAIRGGCGNADFPGDGGKRSAEDDAFWERVEREGLRIAGWVIDGLAITGRAELAPGAAQDGDPRG